MLLESGVPFIKHDFGLRNLENPRISREPSSQNYIGFISKFTMALKIPMDFPGMSMDFPSISMNFHMTMDFHGFWWISRDSDGMSKESDGFSKDFDCFPRYLVQPQSKSTTPQGQPPISILFQWKYQLQ